MGYQSLVSAEYIDWSLGAYVAARPGKICNIDRMKQFFVYYNNICWTLDENN